MPSDPLGLQPEPTDSLTPEQQRELVARIRAGDARAFERIFVAYFPALCRFVRPYMRSPDEAEELVQEVFLRIWQQRTAWAPSNLRAYLFGAARNSAINVQRHNRVIARFEEAAVREQLIPGVGQRPVPPDVAIQTSELAAALKAAVNAMPERRRQVVILRWEHHMSQSEIAQALGITVRTVETQFARAMVFLRNRLASFRR